MLPLHLSYMAVFALHAASLKTVPAVPHAPAPARPLETHERSPASDYTRPAPVTLRLAGDGDGPTARPWWTLGPAPDTHGATLARRLSDGVAQRDKRIGVDLQAGATVARELRRALWEYAPDAGRAEYSALFSASGALLSLRLDQHAGGARGAWLRAAVQAREALSERRFPLPARFAHGASVRLKAQSWRQLPSGGGRPTADAAPPEKVRGWRWLKGPPRMAAKEERAVTFADADGRVHWDYDGPPLLNCVRHRVPLGPADGGFDVTDIGARPARQVAVRFDAAPLE